MSVVVRYPWTRQPQAPVTVSAAYPNARVWIPSLGVFSVGGNSQITQTSFGTRSVSRLGVTFEHTGADFNNGWTIPAAAATNGCALVIVLGRTASAGAALAQATNDTLNGQSGGVATLSTFSTLRCTGALLVGDGSVIVAQSKTSDHALAHRTANGAVEIVRSATGSGGNWATTTNLCRYANTGIALIAQIPNTSLSDAALLRLLANPWGELLGPIQRRVFSVEAAASGNEIAVPAGSVALSGFAPEISSPNAVAVPAGSVTISCFAPTVGVSQNVAVPAAALALTGQVPTVTSPKAVGVPAGSVTLAGFAPAVTNSSAQNIAIPKGSITLSALIPRVTDGSPATDNALRYDINTGRLVKTINTAIVISF